MTYADLVSDIKKRLKNSESYHEIGVLYNLNKAVIWKIAHDKRVSKKTLAHLNLEPSVKLKATRERREKLDKIARINHSKSWCAQETKIIKEYEEAGLI